MGAMAYDKWFMEGLRLTVLRILAELPSGTTNESMLDRLAHEVYGYDKDRRRMRQALRWLEGQALVSLDQKNENCIVATITATGQRVAEGSQIVPGVQPPERRD